METKLIYKVIIRNVFAKFLLKEKELVIYVQNLKRRKYKKNFFLVENISFFLLFKRFCDIKIPLENNENNKRVMPIFCNFQQRLRSVFYCVENAAKKKKQLKNSGIDVTHFRIYYVAKQYFSNEMCCRSFNGLQTKPC